MAYSNINKLKIENSYTIDAHNLELTIAKLKTGRWFIAKEDGTILNSYRSEAECLKKAGKIELRRYNGNLHGLRFGSKIDESTIEAYNAAIWGGLFELTNIRFKKDHYWMADITSTETGKTAKDLRADYLINYMRIPAGLETEAAIAKAINNGARI